MRYAIGETTSIAAGKNAIKPSKVMSSLMIKPPLLKLAFKVCDHKLINKLHAVFVMAFKDGLVIVFPVGSCFANLVNAVVESDPVVVVGGESVVSEVHNILRLLSRSSKLQGYYNAILNDIMLHFIT
jgi:hypothetical protein